MRNTTGNPRAISRVLAVCVCGRPVVAKLFESSGVESLNEVSLFVCALFGFQVVFVLK